MADSRVSRADSTQDKKVTVDITTPRADTPLQIVSSTKQRVFARLVPSADLSTHPDRTKHLHNLKAMSGHSLGQKTIKHHAQST